MGAVSEGIGFNRLEKYNFGCYEDSRFLVVYVFVIKATTTKPLTFLSNVSSIIYPEEQKVAELPKVAMCHRQYGGCRAPPGCYLRAGLLLACPFLFNIYFNNSFSFSVALGTRSLFTQ